MQTAISFQKAQISGLTLVKLSGDTVTGSFVNEFGLKGFDFITSNGKSKVMNLMKPLDKWYIRRTLSEDLAFIFTVTRSCNSGESFVITKFDSGKTVYTDKLDSDGKISEKERQNKGVKTGELIMIKDRSFLMKNIKRKLTYQMNLIPETGQNIE